MATKKRRSEKGRGKAKGEGEGRPRGATRRQSVAEQTIWPSVARVLLILAALAASYILSLGNDFVYDDRYVILNNEVVTDPAKTAQAFDVQFYAGLNYYRPIPLLIFALEYRLWGSGPLGYHVTNLLLLMGVAVALYYLLLRLLGKQRAWPACLLALCFGLHPAVSSIGMALGARGDLLSILFILCAFLCYVHRSLVSYAFALVFFALALLSKETAVTFPVLLLLMETLGAGPPLSGSDRGMPGAAARSAGARSMALRLFPFWAVLAAYGVLRVAVLPGLGSELALDPVLTIKSYLYLFQTSLLPSVGLAYEPFFDDWFSWTRFGLSLALAGVIVAMFVLTDKTRHRRIAFWLAWAAATFIPTANILGQETIFDERYTVLPTIGVIVAVGLLVYYVGASPRAYRRGKLAFCILLLACFAAITVGRGRTWSDDSTFFAQWMKSSPENPRPRHHLGLYFWEKGRREIASGLFSDAVRLEPEYVPSLNMMGLSAYLKGEFDEAIRYCSKALELDPSYKAAHYNVAGAYYAKGDYDQAQSHYAAAAKLDPQWLEAVYGVAKTSQELDRYEDAVINYRRVLELDPTVPQAYYGLSEVYEELGRPSQAIGLLRQGLAHAPGDTAAARRLQRLLHEGGRPPQRPPEEP